MKSTYIYLLKDNQQRGPFTLDQVEKMWNAGSLTAVVPYWHEGMSDWRQLEELFVEHIPLLPIPAVPQQSIANRFLLEKMVEEQKKTNYQFKWFKIGLGLLALGIILKLIAWGLW